MEKASKPEQREGAIKPPPSTDDILAEAVEYLDDLFDQGDDVNGGDIVEWLAEWHVKARAALQQKVDSSDL